MCEHNFYNSTKRINLNQTHRRDSFFLLFFLLLIHRDEWIYIRNVLKASQNILSHYILFGRFDWRVLFQYNNRSRNVREENLCESFQLRFVPQLPLKSRRVRSSREKLTIMNFFATFCFLE